MKRIKNRSERQAANRAYQDAKKRLNSYTPKGGREDAEYLRRNAAVESAETRVSWFQQLKSN